MVACVNNGSGFLDCEVSEDSEEESVVHVKFSHQYSINNMEFWQGTQQKIHTIKDHQAEYKISIILQIDTTTNEKLYQLKIQIADSLMGISTFSLDTNDIEQIQPTKIELPENRNGNISYLVSLKYGSPLSFNAQQTKIADMYFETQSLGEENIFGIRPVKVVPWEDGVLPIVFKKGVSENIKNLIWQACAEWSAAAKVKCVAGPYKDRKLVISNNYWGIDGGCWSMLGQSTYFLWLKRRMNIGKNCDAYSVVLHELGHALGLGHEHQRPDRDQYIKILKENISDPYLGLNTKMNFSTQEGQALSPYDFTSIMHYAKFSFSKNGKATMLPQPGYERFENIMGRTGQLSQNDIASIRRIYGSR